jgi:hypothetical protein
VSSCLRKRSDAEVVPVFVEDLQHEGVTALERVLREARPSLTQHRADWSFAGQAMACDKPGQLCVLGVVAMLPLQLSLNVALCRNSSARMESVSA